MLTKKGLSLTLILTIFLFGGKISAGVTAVHSEEEIQQYLDKKDPVVIDFYWEECGPCKTIAPEYEKLSNKYTDVIFLKSESADQACHKKYQVGGYPTFVFFKDGKEVSRFSGGRPDELRKQVGMISKIQEPAQMPEEAVVKKPRKPRKSKMENDKMPTCKKKNGKNGTKKRKKAADVAMVEAPMSQEAPQMPMKSEVPSPMPM